VVGFLILLYVVINAKVAAQVLGFVWLGIGLIVLVVFYVTGRRPELAGLSPSPSEEEIR
jgi:1-acyl-sn-glycerol-3-phosphate acyltransferase